MDLPKHPAIHVFCGIIDQLPAEAKRLALGFSCMALGEPGEPTGIPITEDREFRHLFWPHETKDLYKRFAHLVDEIGLKEQLVVQGAAAYIETHFQSWANEEFSERSVAALRLTLADKTAIWQTPMNGVRE